MQSRAPLFFGQCTGRQLRHMPLLHSSFYRFTPMADPAAFVELSMGMSGDFEEAILEGATIVRIGSAIFEGVA